eukprot:TRINITY_DN1269_c1_g1_i1.p1 TRINITY_DN1269_c1_g1~~TRINITY_DN1269_c1_g1_i1.p1  ORF type:complete len:272 (-),score=66.11 TRINITY_DN1269_c1_g1_i1:76-891(-)
MRGVATSARCFAVIRPAGAVSVTSRNIRLARSRGISSAHGFSFATPCADALRVSDLHPRRKYCAAAGAAASTCEMCGSVAANGETLICGNCGALLPPPAAGAASEASADYFALLGLQPSYEVAAASVDEAYKTLQRKLHPDHHATAGERQQAFAEAHSARLNEAASVLRSPLRRARYWMERHGVRVLQEDQRMDDAATMMEVMELSEELSEAESREELNKVLAVIESKIGEVESQLVHIFQQDDWEGARRSVERLQMLTRLDDRAGDRRDL